MSMTRWFLKLKKRRRRPSLKEILLYILSGVITLAFCLYLFLDKNSIGAINNVSSTTSEEIIYTNNFAGVSERYTGNQISGYDENTRLEGEKEKIVQNETLAEVSNQSSSNFLPQHALNNHRQLDKSNQNTNIVASMSSQYVRYRKVFVLIVQDGPYNSPIASSSTSFYNHISQHQSKTISSNFILSLLSVLEYHRVDYEWGTTYDGLPDDLISSIGSPSDVNNDKNPTKKISVIIIDDIVKYSRLNRYTRDKLERLCRLNNIGIVFFMRYSAQLYEDLSEKYKQSTQQESPSSTIHPQQVYQKGSLLLDNLPLSLKPIFHHSNCTKQISDESNTQNNCDNQIVKCLENYQVSENAPILRLVKSKKDFVLRGPLPYNIDKSPWVSMSSDHITFQPITFARLKTKCQATSNKIPQASYDEDNHEDLSRNYKRDLQTSSLLFNNDKQQEEEDELMIMSMYDSGSYDGIKKVIFGGDSSFWLHKALLVDAIESLASGFILTPLERFIQVDIDDIFVGESGKRMTKSDVYALIDGQRRLGNRIVGNFKFHLGYSGKYFKHGNDEENEGDEELVKNAHEFAWFCHTWSHSKAHLFNNVSSIVDELTKNRRFAFDKKLPIIGQSSTMLFDKNSNKNSNKNEDSLPLAQPTYAVAPHHSGVYPVHDELYDAWRTTLNVQVTSTEEYPTLYPAHARQAFVYKNISVLPRQTCGLYTHTIRRALYPGGARRLDALIEGGALFETILFNQINIYMSHMTNYASDRLALSTFEQLVGFVQNYTSLQLRYEQSTTFSSSKPLTTSTSSSSSTNNNNNNNPVLGPKLLAQRYFAINGLTLPIWTNPCTNKRHMDIWSGKKRQLCKFVPQVLLVGPQKTGSTALLEFLKINKHFRSSYVNVFEDFEEVQYFNDKHYSKPVHWYMEKFAKAPLAPKLLNYSSSASVTPNNDNDSNDNDNEKFIYIDKSATYFDDPNVAWRAHSLLPNALIVVSLVNPVDRAYSWYQHSRAHNNTAAIRYSFEQVISGSSGDIDESLALLRRRCLLPGLYATHLSRWLRKFSARRLIIVDGQWFRQRPALVLNKLQNLLLKHVASNSNYPFKLLANDKIVAINYDEKLVFDTNKGFYCQLITSKQHSNKVKCLGASKGRKYPPMSLEARKYLSRYYRQQNVLLARILGDQLGQPLPAWLDESLGDASRLAIL